MADETKSLTLRIKGDTAQARAEFRAFQKELQGMQGGIAGAAGALRGFAGLLGAFGIGLSIASIVKFTKAQIDSADELSKLSQRLGTSVEDLSAFQFAAGLAGASSETMTKALEKLASSMQEAVLTKSSQAARVFDALGISIQDTAGNLRNTSDVLQDLAAKFSGAVDGTNKLAAARALLGKGGGELIPLLNNLTELTEEAKRTGNIVSTEFARDAEQFNDSIERMGKRIGTFTRDALGLAIPVWNQWIERINVATGAQERLSLQALEVTRALLGAQISGLLARPEAARSSLQRAQIDRLREDIDEIDAQIIAANRKILAAEATRKLKTDLPTVTPGDPDVFKKALADLEKRIELLGKETAAEQILFEVQQGRYAHLAQAEKDALVAAAARFDAAKSLADFEKEALDDLREQIKAEEEHNAALEKSAEAVRNIIDPARQLFAEMDKLDELYRRGKLSIDEYLDATIEVQGRLSELGEETKKTSDDMTEFAKEAARGMQGAFADEFFDILDGRVENLGESFTRLLKRLAAELAASEFMKFLTGDFGKTGEVGGALGSLFAGLFHEGGIVGEGGPGRMVPALAFAHPQILHGGGIAGLRQDEVPAILRKNEVVFTPEQLRGRGGLPDVKVVVENKGTPIVAQDTQLSFDGDAMVVKVLTEDLHRGGRISGAIARTFNLKRGG